MRGCARPKSMVPKILRSVLRPTLRSALRRTLRAALRNWEFGWSGVEQMALGGHCEAVATFPLGGIEDFRDDRVVDSQLVGDDILPAL